MALHCDDGLGPLHSLRLQVPIDPKYWGWVEMFATLPGGECFCVGYMLLTGSDAGGADSVETSKGTFCFDDGKEYWFTPSVSAEMGDIAQASSLTWQSVGHVNHGRDTAKATLSAWIEGSAGLQDQTSTTLVEPVLVGPSGAVIWSDDPANGIPTDYCTFEVTIASTHWCLGVRQGSSNILERIAWGRSAAPVNPSSLNSSFAGEVEMAITTAQPIQPEYTYLYV